MKLLKDGEFTPLLALIDLGLPPMPDTPAEGFKLVGDLLAFSPDIRILVLSGQNEQSNARRARALGALDLVPKPCEPSHLRRLLLSALQGREVESATAADEQAGGIIGDSPPMRNLKNQIDLYASSTFPALIEGESGSGKERVATALHHLSRRASLPFLALNCAAISANLVEPTLFGYAKGAFTGAANAKSGYFEDAGEGTLFLDEIGELPLELQPKLLRVLENGEFQRVGETQSRRSQARIIAATNRDLKAEVKAGRFRSDLYHRLSVFSIVVPPLRVLGEDKLKLLDHYRAQYAAKYAPQQSSAAPARAFTLSAEARAGWLAYHFPGNVRELKNIVIRLTAKYTGYEVGKAELLAEFESAAETAADPVERAASAREPRLEIENNAAFSLDARLKELELQYIDAALDLSQGNMSQAARVLGVSRSTLYSRLEVLRPGTKKTE
jgi:DNA-binding NtrC family response regulator